MFYLNFYLAVSKLMIDKMRNIFGLIDSSDDDASIMLEL